MIVLEFETRAHAESVLSAINAMGEAWYRDQGALIVESDAGKYVQSVDANGNPIPGAITSSSWVNKIEESPDGTFFFRSLTGRNPAWENWKAVLATFGVSDYGTEKQVPSSWVQEWASLT